MSEENKTCYHCGETIEEGTAHRVEDKEFCCLGCKTVYEILSANNMESYYTIEKQAGAKPDDATDKFHFLSNSKIVEQLLQFKSDSLEIVEFYIPHIHCSSCIWVLENLHKLHKGVLQAVVNFPRKRVRISYNPTKISLKELVELLAHIGYTPYISLEDMHKDEKQAFDKTLLYKLGVAGFAFGNVMLLSLPGFFESDEYWYNQYKWFFRFLNVILTLPVLFYSASDYFVSAFKSIRSGHLNIDVPLAVGIIVMFVRSLVDMVIDVEQGFLDSLNGLVFFLLLGKFFQQKTYNFLSFERDYKSYFPIGVTKINSEGEESIPVYDIQVGDRLLIRNQELIPCDAVLIKGEAHIDYSFVTGEACLIEKISGEKLFAGGKQKGGAIEVEAIKSVSQSYLTELWNNDSFAKDKFSGVKNFTNKVSEYFTIGIFSISILGFIYWWWSDGFTMAFNVFTAVLIIACPCALALSAPFTLGNMLRILGKHQFYLKDTLTIEQLAKIDTIIFDKTGTITKSNQSNITYRGSSLNQEEMSLLKAALRGSNHPLSRQIYELLKETPVLEGITYNEIEGKGIEASKANLSIKIGSASFVGASSQGEQQEVCIAVNNELRGRYLFENVYRHGMEKLFNELGEHYELAILSGDNPSEEARLKGMLSQKVKMYFNQKPHDKLQHIAHLQKQGKKVLMLGDGLNDAGALKQSTVGVAVSENINVFSPACEGIIDAGRLNLLGLYLRQCKSAMKVIRWSLVLSLCYNTIGLSFALSGNLLPVVAAILMPISSVSVVLFTTTATGIIGRGK